MSRTNRSFHCYNYTISNYADTYSYYDTGTQTIKTKTLPNKPVTIINKSALSITVKNPYFGATYSETTSSVTVAGGETSTSAANLYNDYTTFTAFYSDGSEATVEKVEPIRHPKNKDETDSEKRTGYGHITGYTVYVK